MVRHSVMSSWEESEVASAVSDTFTYSTFHSEQDWELIQRYKLMTELKVILCFFFFLSCCCCFVQHVSGPCNVRSKHLAHRLSRHWRAMAIVSVSLKLLDLGPVLWFLTLSWLKLHFTNAGVFPRNFNLVWHRHFDFNEAKRKKCWYLLREVEPKLGVTWSFAVIHHNSISFYSALIVLSENEWVLLLLFPLEVIFPHNFHGPMLLSPVLILLGIGNIKPSKWYLGKEIGLESNPDLESILTSVESVLQPCSSFLYNNR